MPEADPVVLEIQFVLVVDGRVTQRLQLNYGTATSTPIRARGELGPKSRNELLREAIDCLLSGDIAPARVLLRD
jgi:hypothetical protein